MSYEFYKVLHYIGLVLAVFGLFGLASALLATNGTAVKPGLRKLWVISHGVGLLFLLIAGFGLLARMGLARQVPHWAYAKLVIWLALGGILTLIKRQPKKNGLWLGVIFAMVFTAILLAVTKPF